MVIVQSMMPRRLMSLHSLLSHFRVWMTGEEREGMEKLHGICSAISLSLLWESLVAPTMNVDIKSWEAF